MDLNQFLDRLPSYRTTGAGRYVAKCPSHDDASPSLSITEGKDGRVLVHCYAGCSVFDVCAAVGVEVSDLFPDTDKNFPGIRQHKREELHDYVVEIYEAQVEQGTRVSKQDKARYRQALLSGGKRNGFVDDILKAMD